MDSCTIQTIVTESSTFARIALSSTRLNPPFPLKPLPADSGYPGDQCAAEGCERTSDIIDGTHRFWKEDVPLCALCYERRPDPPLRTEPILEEVARITAGIIASQKPLPPEAVPTSEELWDLYEDQPDQPEAPAPKPAKLKSFKLFG